MRSLKLRLLALTMPLLLLISCNRILPQESSEDTGSTDVSAFESAKNSDYDDDYDDDYNDYDDNDDDDYYDKWRVSVAGEDGQERWSFTEAELESRLAQKAKEGEKIQGLFSHIYSTINNWPISGFYAAQGYTVADILLCAGLYDEAQTVTFRAEDGYEVALTREQLFSEQYYYPQVGKSESGAQAVFPIIAYRWNEDSEDLSSIEIEKPCLIFGQKNPFEHTNPAFIEEISEIIVSTRPPDIWAQATTFPLPGQIAAGETVKLQHPNFGMVKLHYTLDGSEPTALSPMYNPSTYQPELTVPIAINEPTIIKVLAVGFGKNNSDIAIFEFEPV